VQAVNGFNSAKSERNMVDIADFHKFRETNAAWKRLESAVFFHPDQVTRVLFRKALQALPCIGGRGRGKFYDGKPTVKIKKSDRMRIILDGDGWEQTEDGAWFKAGSCIISKEAVQYVLAFHRSNFSLDPALERFLNGALANAEEWEREPFMALMRIDNVVQRGIVALWNSIMRGEYYNDLAEVPEWTAFLLHLNTNTLEYVRKIVFNVLERIMRRGNGVIRSYNSPFRGRKVFKFDKNWLRSS
jgi:hypothetical protein